MSRHIIFERLQFFLFSFFLVPPGCSSTSCLLYSWCTVRIFICIYLSNNAYIRNKNEVWCWASGQDYSLRWWAAVICTYKRVNSSQIWPFCCSGIMCIESQVSGRCVSISFRHWQLGRWDEVGMQNNLSRGGDSACGHVPIRMFKMDYVVKRCFLTAQFAHTDRHACKQTFPLATCDIVTHSCQYCPSYMWMWCVHSALCPIHTSQ